VSGIDWDRVRVLFQDAVDRPPDERASYLLAECAGDQVLRHEVESLLAAHDRAEGFLEDAAGRPRGEAPQRVGNFEPGSRLGAFEILGLIGEGGMGEVYRARDTRLDRLVAIKILSADIADDPRSRERFTREAQIVSKLAHPHICTLHDLKVATVDGVEVPFLVMELLHGETLAMRLARGPLPVDQAVRSAVEIAEALAAAHALDVVHRDLKPANIMLTASGVKLLDFGLARWRGPVVPGGTTGAGADGAARSTGGLVMGTLPYMAPEQVRGEAVDARTDLFAFGAVLYEMLTGARAFAADSQAALIAAILDHDPIPVASLQPLAPPALGRLVTRCLAKTPAERWQHAQDVAFELKEISDSRAEPHERPAGLSGSRTRRPAVPGYVPWVLLGGILGLLLWLWFERGDTPVTTANALPVIVLMDSPGRVYDPATAADGGTNADDVSDALTDLAVVVYKENTSSMWHREEHVRRQNPDLIISHLSCLLDARQANTDQALEDHLFALAEARLTLFFGYIATTNPRTRFLVYSRSRFATNDLTGSWMSGAIARFPVLEGRVHLMSIPGGRASATFRDPATARMLRDRVKAILGLR
jgi:serine/threonine protein kinase